MSSSGPGPLAALMNISLDCSSGPLDFTNRPIHHLLLGGRGVCYWHWLNSSSRRDNLWPLDHVDCPREPSPSFVVYMKSNDETMMVLGPKETNHSVSLSFLTGNKRRCYCLSVFAFHIKYRLLLFPHVSWDEGCWRVEAKSFLPVTVHTLDVLLNVSSV